MRHDLMEIIVCPLCKSELTLTVAETAAETAAATTADEAAGEIVTGTLACTGCNETYPIEDGIPNLLPPDLRD